ncbi:MAG: acyl-CoA dehydrogenase family protein [Microthrixaceae bacterium]
MLDLDFTEEQEMLREMVRGVCAQYSPNEVVRRYEDDPDGYAPELWGQLAELGLLGLMLPEEYGGAGSSLLDGVVLAEELGASLAPVPYLESCVLSAGVLVAAGSDEQLAAWLGPIVDGSAIVVPAWLEPGNGYSPKGVQATATPTGDGFVLSGSKAHVRFAKVAARLVVLARTGAGDTDVDLFLVDPTAAGVTLTQQMTISSDTQYRVDLDGVEVSAADRIGDPGTGWATWSKAMEEAMVIAAALANGGAEHALDITTQYAKDREQFGKPLGAFQALSHYLADAKTVHDGAKLLTYEAAWAQGAGRSLQKLAPMAKLFSCNSYRDLTATAQQIFGGVGFTLEYEIQLYFRRAKQLQLSWNDTRRCEELVAVAVLDGEPAPA